MRRKLLMCWEPHPCSSVLADHIKQLHQPLARLDLLITAVWRLPKIVHIVQDGEQLATLELLQETYILCGAAP